MLSFSHYRPKSFQLKIDYDSNEPTVSPDRFHMLQELRTQIEKRINEASELNKQRYSI